MKCPECGAPTSVLRTRGDQRRRLCYNGHRFTTIETLKTKRKTRWDSPRRSP